MGFYISEYKQTNSNQEITSDSSLFSTTLIPLKLLFGNKTVWINPFPSSTRFCRPIRIQYIKESTEFLVEEQKNVQNRNDYECMLLSS